MDSEKVLNTLKEIRFKYSSKKEPKWFETATEEEKAKYEADRNEKYEALNAAIKIVKAYRSLETANKSIVDALSAINEVNDDE